ncbi:C-type lectin domain family 7 member A isoform X2 [Tenrec ecaudatus]|uniref:C-type lectin domain family 7 member A isoform X2 n=1 Tax=Tenrec ecaudatus TaxID=94439 RepID=UPI003F5ACD81
MMECRSNVDNLDEDGYTQLDFRSRGISRRPIISEKGTCASSSRCCFIAVTVGILLLIALGIAVVLGTLASWGSKSGSSPLENTSFPTRSNPSPRQPTKSPLEESVTSTKSLRTRGAASSLCPRRWILYEKSCYLFRPSLDSWAMSKEKCSLENSHLLKIDDLGELDFITSQTSLQPDRSFWIGLARPQAERGWLWEDGSAFSDLFQIHNTVLQKNVFPICAWVHQSLIYDQLCNISSYSICEKALENNGERMEKE